MNLKKISLVTFCGLLALNTTILGNNKLFQIIDNVEVSKKDVKKVHNTISALSHDQTKLEKILNQKNDFGDTLLIHTIKVYSLANSGLYWWLYGSALQEALKNMLRIIVILKCAGADIFIKDYNGDTAYDIAQRNNQTQIMTILESGIKSQECKDI